MILSEAIFESARSSAGGWSREQVLLLGERWPLKRGWRKRLVGKDYPDAVVRQFVNLRNRHLQAGRVDRIEMQKAAHEHMAAIKGNG